MLLKKNSRIFIAGHNGMVGSSIFSYFRDKGYNNIFVESKKKLNLIDQYKVQKYLNKIKPDVVINAAGKVGGILVNSKLKADFIYENLMIQTNLIHGSFKANVKNLINLGSSCIYPKLCKQPIKEDYLLTGKLEETNDAYAIAKIVGVKLCEFYSKQYNLNYICLMPSNLYGPNDNYDSKTSHFFPALIKKIYYAKLKKKNSIIIWGNGNAKRELTYVKDVAIACEFFLKKKTSHSLINIGSGDERTIKNFCKFIMNKLNTKLKINFDKSKPDGTPRKILDQKLAQSYGWKSQISLDEGFKITYENFIKKINF